MVRFGFKRDRKESGPGLSASGLLAALHEMFAHKFDKSMFLDSLSTLVIDKRAPEPFLETVFSHATERSEDELLLLFPAHDAAHSLLFGTASALPMLDSRVLTALSVLQPFLTAMTPSNLNQRFHNGLCLKLGFNAAGSVASARLQLSAEPLLSLAPLLDLSTDPNFRAFDAFYHMLYSQMDDSDQAAMLSLKSDLSQYELLAKSQTYVLPSWVAFADDYALAKDWADNMREIFPRPFVQAVFMALSGMLLLGNESLADRAEGAALVGFDVESARDVEPHTLIAAAYTSLLQSLEAQINKYLAKLDLPDTGNEGDAIHSIVSLAELASTHRYRHAVLKSRFDNESGINAEMVQDGILLPPPPQNVRRSLNTNSYTDFQFPSEIYNIEDAQRWLDPSAMWYSSPDEPLDLDALFPACRIWTAFSLAPSATAQSVADQTAWNSAVVSAQIRDLFLTEWIQRGQAVNFTTDFDIFEFLEMFQPLLPNIGPDELSAWAAQHFSPIEFFQGHHRVYLNERAWTQLNSALGGVNVNTNGYNGISAPNMQAPPSMYAPSLHPAQSSRSFAPSFAQSVQSAQGTQNGQNGQNFLGPQGIQGYNPGYSPGYAASARSYAPSGINGQAESVTTLPTIAKMDLPAADNASGIRRQVVNELQEPYYTRDPDEDEEEEEEDDDLLKGLKGLEGGQIEVFQQSTSRKLWVAFVWAITWWIPSPVLSFIGRMRRKDVRLAWREKVVIFFLIFLLNAFIIFYMIILGRLICPDYDKVWNHKELSYHQGTSDFYVGVHGKVYDITKFYRQQHSDNGIQTSASVMLPFAGLDLSDYFPPPLTIACPSLVTDESVKLVYNATTSPYSEAMHVSGSYFVPSNDTALHDYTWYAKVFLPKMEQYYKGHIVETDSKVAKMVAEDDTKYLVIYDKKIYDMTNYILTINQYSSSKSSLYDKYNFFPTSVSNLFQNYQGQDITEQFNALDETTRTQCLECMNNMFLYGYHDFRDSAKCQTANIILLVIAALLTTVTLVKFLASIRFGPKPMPAPQDKFVICQVPIYTEGEDDMRLAIDSLTNLDYDNRRKLIVLICDGMITGAGNDRPTPEIALDILGVDETRVETKLCAYHAIAEGSRELNYAKVYSGLYENEGDIVPFICIVKVGAEGELRPGNRGKRDSQLILMNFLNRVHYADPMCPLDLELFHHINNIIGIEPERFEYLLTVDADTRVDAQSLNRMVAACTSDNTISAVCGETGIQNEKESLSTMVQVYEYFISHHLTKAFESLFGSVTCLPGCFSLYRLRSVKRAKPILISSEIIREYSLRHVDTLHKKNLFSLGEDRYLTTLMSKHFSKMKTKFIADAKCETRVPSEFSVLLSQRRRWINSTVHNLAELLYLPTLCGFCLFSMRGIVFIDLIGTLMLPSVVIYLAYLIYIIASKTQPLPLISIILICSVYGLQALVFILHRRWQHVFWMIVYIAAYPFHSFILPIYSFWYMDDFSWGNTRVVIDESKGKKVVIQDEHDVYDPQSVPFEPWTSYATRKGLPGRERAIIFDNRKGKLVREVLEDPAHYANWEKSQADFNAYEVRSLNDKSTFNANDAMSGTNNRHSRAPSVTTVNTLNVSEFDAGTAAQIRETIQQILSNCDLSTMTSSELRDRVSDMLGMTFAGPSADAIDALIDIELEKLDD